MSASNADHTSVPGSQIAKLLLPDVNLLRLDGVVIDAEGVTIRATSWQDAVCCPVCGQPSQREHSRYIRRPRDLPCIGRALRLQLTVRRFFCDNAACPRQTFAERLPGVVRVSARRTERLAELQRQIGLALGGEAGARHAAQLDVPVSPDTLLRLISETTEHPRVTPRALGIDDWAWRKRQRYGTILVDLERHCVVDILPDRSADTVADWLQAHPGVEIISRDRGGIYAEGARRGAPEAVQVADRWHLLANLREALERLLIRQHTALPRVTDVDEKEHQSVTPSEALETVGAAPTALSAPDGIAATDWLSADAAKPAGEPPAAGVTKDQLQR